MRELEGQEICPRCQGVSGRAGTGIGLGTLKVRLAEGKSQVGGPKACGRQGGVCPCQAEAALAPPFQHPSCSRAHILRSALRPFPSATPRPTETVFPIFLTAPCKY